MPPLPRIQTQLLGVSLRKMSLDMGHFRCISGDQSDTASPVVFVVPIVAVVALVAVVHVVTLLPVPVLAIPVHPSVFWRQTLS